MRSYSSFRHSLASVAMTTTLVLSLAFPTLAAFTLDGTFNGGKVTVEFPDSSTNYSSRGIRVLVQPSGRIVAAGTFTRQTPDGQRSGVVVFGLTTTGMIDAGYVQSQDWQANGSTSLNDLWAYGDGRLIRLSRFLNHVASATGWAVRHNGNGSLDSGFGALGSSSGGFGTVNPRQVAVRNDGKVNVLITEEGQWLLYRFNADGSKDSTFGNNGVIALSFSRISSMSIAQMLVQPDGKILLIGNIGPVSFPAGSAELYLLRLTESGLWDKTFGRLGVQRMPFGSGLSGRITNAILQPDGKVILCGSLSDSDLDTWLMRFRSNGRPDSTFGNNGVVVQDFSPGVIDVAYSMALSADGKIRIAGAADAPVKFLVARYAANGGFEESTTLEFTAGQDSQANDIAIQPDGKLVVIGETRNPNSSILGNVFAVARLTE